MFLCLGQPDVVKAVLLLGTGGGVVTHVTEPTLCKAIIFAQRAWQPERFLGKFITFTGLLDQFCHHFVPVIVVDISIRHFGRATSELFLPAQRALFCHTSLPTPVTIPVTRPMLFSVRGIRVMIRVYGSSLLGLRLRVRVLSRKLPIVGRGSSSDIRNNRALGAITSETNASANTVDPAAGGSVQVVAVVAVAGVTPMPTAGIRAIPRHGLGMMAVGRVVMGVGVVHEAMQPTHHRADGAGHGVRRAIVGVRMTDRDIAQVRLEVVCMHTSFVPWVGRGLTPILSHPLPRDPRGPVHEHPTVLRRDHTLRRGTRQHVGGRRDRVALAVSRQGVTAAGLHGSKSAGVSP